jgi:hypothetical protein
MESTTPEIVSAARSEKQGKGIALKRKLDKSFMLLRTIDLTHKLGRADGTTQHVDTEFDQGAGTGGGGGGNSDNPSPANDNKPHTTSNGGGNVIQNANIHLLFWGNVWNSSTTTPNVAAVVNAVDDLVNGTFFNELSQYGVRGAQVADANIIGPDPGTDFTSQCPGIVLALINEGLYPAITNAAGYNELFAFILPPGVGGVTPNSGWAGDHTFATTSAGKNVYYLWVNNDENLSDITAGLSHEIAESCTDPDGNEIQINPRNSSNWNEISDICENQYGTVNSVTVQKYWSDSSNACVIPTKPNSPVPTGASRAVSISAKFTINTNVNTSSPQSTWFEFSRTAILDNNGTSREVVLTTPGFDAFSANVVMSIAWHNDFSIGVSFTSAFFQGVNLRSTYANTFSLPAGWWENYEVWHAINNGADKCDITFTVTNNQG